MNPDRHISADPIFVKFEKLGFGAFLLSGLLFGSGCGGAAVPNEALTAAKAEIRAAEVAGVEKQPNAARHLKYARDLLAQAEGLIAKEENEEAYWLLLRAEADAELAVAISQEEFAVAQASEALEQVERMKKQLKAE